MKLAVTILLIGCALAAEEPPPASKSAAKTAAKGTAASDAAPKSATGATKVVQTPFGPSLRAATPDDSREEAEKRHQEAVASPLLKIEESGDTVTFRRRTPFGDQVWKKKRSELTDLEKEMIAAHQGGGTKTGPGADPGPGRQAGAPGARAKTGK
ncbi:MAG TPA: hypothetical protein VEU62_19950 [Bryobacterales bacterium]|nr:hypothetical protein [Bryobacterales bacterium]